MIITKNRTLGRFGAEAVCVGWRLLCGRSGRATPGCWVGVKTGWVGARRAPQGLTPNPSQIHSAAHQVGLSWSGAASTVLVAGAIAAAAQALARVEGRGLPWHPAHPVEQRADPYLPRFTRTTPACPWDFCPRLITLLDSPGSGQYTALHTFNLVMLHHESAKLTQCRYARLQHAMPVRNAPMRLQRVTHARPRCPRT